MHKVRQLIGKAAKTPFAVLLLGESGTGKEVAARAIHNASSRAAKQFVVIDCGALVSTLVESELFGYVRGAFSGAIANKMGLVEVADGGTIFLDEIGDLTLDLQVKLLRLLQEREFRPVGALFSRTVDVRFIAATNRDLAAEVAAGRFRLDLYQRLNVFPIHLPALRDRIEDISLLAKYFLLELERSGLPVPDLNEERIGILREHSWPGNVRELKHYIERMVALEVEDSEEFRQMLLQAGCVHGRPPASGSAPKGREGERVEDALMSIPESELRLISAALNAANGNRAKAAEILRISRTTLYRRMRDYRVGCRPAAESTVRGGGGGPSLLSVG